jgi:two-component system cell cycle response regulator DivK
MVYCAQGWPMRRERTQVKTKSVLLVDDSLANLKLTRFLLMQDGFEARTAENAEQALLALDTRIPDMILMDIQMPGMDGLALTRHLRRDWDSSLRSVPIIALKFEFRASVT